MAAVAAVVCLGGCLLLLTPRTRWWQWVLVALVGGSMGTALVFTAAGVPHISLVKTVAQAAPDKFGGKADVAQGGGTDPAGIPAALQAGEQAVATATGR